MDQIGKVASRELSNGLGRSPKLPTSPEYLRAAKLLLGCSRTGEANDPEVYVSAVIKVLSAYPLDVVQRVVDPLTGLPGQLNWLPTVREIREACEEKDGLQRRIREYDERSKKQLAEREER